MSGADDKGTDALDRTSEAANRLASSLEESGRAGGRAGHAISDAASGAADGANAVAVGWHAVLERLDKFVEAGSSVAAQSGDTFINAFGTMERAVSQLVQTGKLRFRDFVSSIMGDLAQIATRRFITAPLAGALSSALGGMGGSWFANVLHSGGIVGSGGRTALRPDRPSVRALPPRRFRSLAGRSDNRSHRRRQLNQGLKIMSTVPLSHRPPTGITVRTAPASMATKAPSSTSSRARPMKTRAARSFNGIGRGGGRPGVAVMSVRPGGSASARSRTPCPCRTRAQCSGSGPRGRRPRSLPPGRSRRNEVRVDASRQRCRR